MECDDSVPDWQFKLAAMTAERDEWLNLETDIAKKLKAAEADIALQSTLREAAREKMDTHTAEITKLQGKLTAKGAVLCHLSAKNRELTKKLNHVIT